MTLALSLPTFSLALPTFSRPAALPDHAASIPPTPTPSELAPEDQDPDPDQDQDPTAAAPPLSTFLSRLALYTPGPPPPSSRVTPSHTPLPPADLLSLTALWSAAAFLSRKAADVAGDVLRHQLYGPKKKSWGLQMTVLSAVMRGMGKYEGLGNLALIRLLMSLPTYLPHSSEALITPITFRVKKRGLRGLLADADAGERGEREITAEWVVSKALWRKLNAEWKRAHAAPSGSGSGTGKRDGHGERDTSAPASRSQSRQRSPKASTAAAGAQSRVKGRVILYLHGGAYYVFNASTHRPITVPLSQACGARVFAINYRLAPETRFPGPLHDAVSAYLRLVEDMRIPPSEILLAGDSAGGGLTLALAMYLRDNGYPLPAGLILMSPWVDLTMSSDSWDSNAAYDIVPVPEPTSHLNPVINYLGPGPDGIGRWLTHPYASPLFGDLSRLPPMLVQCGEAEVLRDEGALLAHKAARAGVDTEHEVFEDAVHVFQMLPWLPQTAKAWESVRAFVRGKVAAHVRAMRGERTGSASPTEEGGLSRTAGTGPEPAAHALAPSPGTAEGDDPRASASAEHSPDPQLALDAESVPPTRQSMVVSGSGAEVALGKEASTREMEAGESGSDSELEGSGSSELAQAGAGEGAGEGTGTEEAEAEAAARSSGGNVLPPAQTAPSSPQRPRQHRRQPSYPTPRPRRSTASHGSYGASASSFSTAAASASSGSSPSSTVPPAGALGLSMSASYGTLRAISPRSRALSHPELKELVRSYWEGPGVRTVRWSLAGAAGAGAGPGEGGVLEEMQRAAAADGAMEDRL
ncbi:hypothetical protein CALCODRAFT_505425 [Calocera cornea HHB12733]|uniref:Alpha/beta hydrolase fold-3 domain-containing protein n=1 Tax=Calocera cornea HHB12733 TaxID=1353952 RepID=A0A165K465_9BASI|nr:hypothetical protein CALCODRAFT_505425 [Calocera cornea HHB12733]